MTFPRRDRPQPAAHPSPAYPESQFLALDGINVHYLKRDAPEAVALPPVYLAHHFYGAGANFLPVARLLHATSVALDRPGFGLTERPKRTRRTAHLYTRRGQAELAWQLITRIYGDTPIVLAGASAGGTHVLEMAGLNPDRVHSLVLIDAAITGDVGPPGWARPPLRAPGISNLGVAVVARKAHTVTKQRVGRSWADPSRVTDDTIAPYRLATTMPRYAYGLYHSFVGDAPPDLRRVLTTLDVPALVLTGSHDPVILPRDAQRIAQAMRHATYQEIRDAGHTPHEEQPAAVAEAIRRFVAGG